MPITNKSLSGRNLEHAICAVYFLLGAIGGMVGAILILLTVQYQLQQQVAPSAPVMPQPQPQRKGVIL